MCHSRSRFCNRRSSLRIIITGWRIWARYEFVFVAKVDIEGNIFTKGLQMSLVLPRVWGGLFGASLGGDLGGHQGRSGTRERLGLQWVVSSRWWNIINRKFIFASKINLTLQISKYGLVSVVESGWWSLVVWL